MTSSYSKFQGGSGGKCTPFPPPPPPCKPDTALILMSNYSFHCRSNNMCNIHAKKLGLVWHVAADATPCIWHVHTRMSLESLPLLRLSLKSSCILFPRKSFEPLAKTFCHFSQLNTLIRRAQREFDNL